MQRTIKITLVALLVLALGGGLLFWFSRKAGLIETPPKVVTDTIVIPKSEKITGAEGIYTRKNDAVAVPLSPKSSGEKVIVTDAVLTAKGSFAMAQKSALAWAPDAKLVFIKTLGTVMLDGKTSYWQLGFGSLKKKSGYEIVIKGDAIASTTEVATAVYGFDPPKNWYDSGDAISSLRTLPQFHDATVTQINFFYDKDAKWWVYSVLTSIGSDIMPVR